MSKPRGRPPLSPDEESTPVSVKLPARLYDQVYSAAQAARVSVPEVVRRAVDREFRNLKSTMPDDE